MSSNAHIADVEPLQCLDQFHVYREQDYPNRKLEIYKPLYEAILFLWKSKTPVAIRIPLGQMKAPDAQKKAHRAAERHGFAVDTQKVGLALWIRKSQKLRDNKA